MWSRAYDRKGTCTKHYLLRWMYLFLSIFLLVQLWIPLWCLWFAGGTWLEGSFGGAATGMPCPLLRMLGEIWGETTGPAQYNFINSTIGNKSLLLWPSRYDWCLGGIPSTDVLLTGKERWCLPFDGATIGAPWIPCVLFTGVEWWCLPFKGDAAGTPLAFPWLAGWIVVVGEAADPAQWCIRTKNVISAP